MVVVELGHVVRGGEPLPPHKGDDRIMWCVHGQALTRQLHSIPIAVSGSGHTEKHIRSFDYGIHIQERTRKAPKFASQAVLSRMQPTFRATR